MSLFRYKVSTDPGRRDWVIYDRVLYAPCGLPSAPDAQPEELVWPSYEAADDWLRRCYRAWGGAPLVNGDVLVDLSPGGSPWWQSPWA